MNAVGWAHRSLLTEVDSTTQTSLTTRALSVELQLRGVALHGKSSPVYILQLESTQSSRQSTRSSRYVGSELRMLRSRYSGRERPEFWPLLTSLVTNLITLVILVRALGTLATLATLAGSIHKSKDSRRTLRPPG